jgi:hypothetical protein
MPVATPSGRKTIAALLGAIALLAAALALVALSREGSRRRPAMAARTTARSELRAEQATEQVHGHILDADGNAVAGAHVRVMAQGPSRIENETTTSPGGAFAFASVGSGRFRVEADRDPGGAVRSAELSLSEESTTELTLVLGPAGVGGIVVDADDGHPVAGAALSVEGVPWSVPRATSDAAGAFHLSLVPFEATSIVAVASGYRAASVTLGSREDQPEPVLRIALRLGPPVDGDVLDPDGNPLHAQVVACEGQPSEARVESADDGTFHLPAAAIGCDAIAMHDDMAPSDAARVTEGRRLTLRLGAGGSIAGSVVDERGSAIDSFSLGIESFVPAHGAGAHRNGATPFRSGSFRLERLVPGTYVLTASAPGKPPARSDPIDVRGGAVVDGVRIVLTAGGVVVGRVFDDRNTPLSGVELRFDLVSAVAGSDAVAKSDDSGSYRLEGAPGGPFTMRAQKEGFRPKLVSGLWVESGRTLTKDLTLTPTDGTSGGTELGGIGASIAPGGGGIVFAAVFPGDPADRAGVRQGDRLVRVDGEDAAGLSVVDAIQRLRGAAGTSVGVSIERGGTVRDLMIERAAILH